MSTPRSDASPTRPHEEPLTFSVVIPTIGGEAKLLLLLEALARQALPREQWELIVAFDGAEPTPAVRERLAALDAQSVVLVRRSGPATARNAGAAIANGTYLAWTEDDVVPAADWLARAADRLAREPALDVLEGETRKPGGRPVRMRGDESLQYLPCNLFVRRSLFERVGRFHEGYFDRGVYFREDADLGFSLENAGARVARESGAVVTHPIEHPGFLDPLRWARRYRMDALLARRFPQRFHDRIEIHALGPLRVRRPIVRASFVFVGAWLAAAVFAVACRPGWAWACGALAALAFLPIWAKWRFELRRVPVFLLVPFVLVMSYVRGFARLRALGASRQEIAAQ